METAEQIAAREELDRLADARGDNFVPADQSAVIELEAQDDPTILALIAGETEVKTEELALEDDKKDAIPRPRFNEVLDKNRALEAELALLRGGVAPAAKEAGAIPDPIDAMGTELKALRQEHRKALSDSLLDLDDEAAQELVEQLDEKVAALQDRLAETKALKTIDTRSAAQSVQGQYQAVITKAYTDFPFLNPQSPAANAELNDNINAFSLGLQASGISKTEALQRAVDTFAPAFAKEQGIAITAPDTNKAAEVKTAREKAAREKAAKASIDQPAALIGKGEKESFTIDISKLTGAQIAALPEETKARLRGDTP